MARTRRNPDPDSSDSDPEVPERNDPEDDDPSSEDEGPPEGEPEGPPEDPEDGDDGEEENAEGPGALTPGLAMRGTLDYQNNKAHNILYNKATQKLAEELYDCTPDQFFPFMKNLEVRANAMGWTSEEYGILWVTRRGGVRINLLKAYGSVSLGRITRHERTYWRNGFRPSQDDRMLFECLMASLSQAGKARIQVHSEEYLLKDGNEEIPSGLCLLKVIVRESYLDSNATTGMIREQLSNLDLYMPTVENDITRFNNHVKMLLEALHARNEKTLDLLTYLFKAYAVCHDKEFTKFIADVQTDHDMGTRRVDAAELMSLAEKKFKIMKTLQKWEAPTHVDDQIMAMQARIDSMQKRLDKHKRKKGGDDQKDGEKKKKKPFQKKPEWLKKPPKAGKFDEVKEWNGDKWHYCCKETGGKCGGVWRTHDPKECRSDPNKSKQKKFKKKKQDVKKAPKVEIKQVLDGESSDEDESVMGGYVSG